MKNHVHTIEQNKKLSKATISDLSRINQLLESENLPLVDHKEFTNYFYKVTNNKNSTIGAIGLEIYGNYGLLRSMVVDNNYRNNGIAHLLIGQIMEISKELGLHEVYLLTTTADKYFLKKGFDIKKRENCPVEIKESKEFSTICPASSVLMSRKTR